MGKVVDYFDDDTRLEGIFFPYEGNKNAPVVLVVPTYAGRDQFTLDKAKSMNNLGYSGFAVDMYGEGKTGSSPEENIELMNDACQILLNYTNFKCFSKSKSDVKTFNCDLVHANWKLYGDELIFKIKANRFLRNMVRAIVGTLIEIGEGKHEISHMDTVIKSKDREVAGYSVPAQGLCLTNIVYPKNSLFDE